MSDEIPVERPDADDYDLLTYGEAGARLVEEIRRKTAELRALEAEGSDDDAIAAVKQRIADLGAAVDRQRVAAAERADFTKFFGYDPTTK
jgi:hypothetical protein